MKIGAVEQTKTKEKNMSLTIKQEQLNKTFTYNNTTKTSRTTMTKLLDGESELLSIDSNDLLRDPSTLLHIARWAGYVVTEKSEISWEEYNELKGDIAWADLGRAERIQIGEKRLNWVREHFDIDVPANGAAFIKEMILTNASLGSEGFMGQPDIPGKVKSPVTGEDFVAYRKKLFAGSKATYSAI